MKIIRYLLLCIAAFSLHSCDNITEEITINEDGSGDYKIYTDMIPGIRKMATEMGGLFQDSTAQAENNDTSMEAFIWKDFQGDIDSVFDYSESMPDSALLNDPKKKEILSRMKGFMEGGKDKGYVNMGVKFSFHDFEDLQTLMENLKEAQQNPTGTGGMGMNGQDELKTDVKYEMKNNIVSRKTKFIHAPEIKEDEMSMYTMMFADAKMQTIVHLPRKVKDVKGEHLLKKDDKTVMFEYSMMDYFLGKVASDFEIAMEK